MHLHLQVQPPSASENESEGCRLPGHFVQVQPRVQFPVKVTEAEGFQELQFPQCCHALHLSLDHGLCRKTVMFQPGRKVRGRLPNLEHEMLHQPAQLVQVQKHVQVLVQTLNTRCSITLPLAQVQRPVQVAVKVNGHRAEGLQEAHLYKKKGRSVFPSVKSDVQMHLHLQLQLELSEMDPVTRLQC